MFRGLLVYENVILATCAHTNTPTQSPSGSGVGTLGAATLPRSATHGCVPNHRLPATAAAAWGPKLGSTALKTHTTLNCCLFKLLLGHCVVLRLTFTSQNQH